MPVPGFSTVDTLRMAYAIESVPGITPQRAFQILRPKSQSLDAGLKYTDSKEFRADRQVSDQILSDAAPGGQIAGELSFGVWDDFFLSTMCQPAWASVFAQSGCGVGSTSSYAVPVGGLNVVANHLIRGTGFANPANNVVSRVTGATPTTISIAGSGLIAESAGDQKSLRVCGFTSASGDLVAIGSGLASSVLNFLTLGLTVGQWVKIGGTAAANQFATSANNTYVRIASISANVLTLDNLPTGWAPDTGAGKTIHIYVSDMLRNGTVAQSFSIERCHSAMSPVQYFLHKGFTIDRATLALSPGQILDVAFDFKGLTVTQGTMPASSDDYIQANLAPIMNANSNIIRIQEGGSDIGYVRRLNFVLTNNAREQKGLGTLGNIGIGQGRFGVAFDLDAYFTSAALYQKHLNAVPTSFAFALRDDLGNAYVMTAPMVKLDQVKINAGSINQDVTLAVKAQGMVDPLTGCMFQIDRFFA
jgi:hypothetical protein